MRIAFNGKGGSGKTTLASLFIRHLEREGHTTLAVDADVNAHLHQALGMDAAPRPIGADYQAVARYFEGDRPALDALAFDAIPELGTMPAGTGSRFVRLTDDPFLDAYGSRRGPLTAVAIGGHDAVDTGDSCYHVKLNGAELLLHRTLDQQDEYVIIDTTAGVDSVGTSLVAAYDLFVFAVEPTAKSVSVFNAFKAIAAASPFPLPCVAVPNKVRTGADLDYLLAELGPDVLPPLPYLPALRKAEQGHTLDWDALVDDAAPTLTAISERAQQCTRDWDAYHRVVCDLYEQRCAGWWNAFTGKPLERLIERDFTYPVGAAAGVAR